MSEKKHRDRLVRWARGRQDALLVWEDECWFSRFAQPTANTWTDRDHPLRLAQRTLAAHALDKALACYGALRDDTRQVYLHFTWGQPDSEATIDYLQRLLALARSLRKHYLVIIWDNASWHLSRKVRTWLKSYKQQAKATADVRLLVCYLPSKSPWLNPIEPRWAHAKRQTLEPSPEPLPPHLLRHRLFQYFGTKPLLPCSTYHE
jgi:transposase